MRLEPVIGPEEFERYIAQGVRLRVTYPELVDQNARLYPKVSEVAVVAYSDQIMGERAAACMVLKPGETLTFSDLIAFLRSKDIAAFKLPERVKVLDSLPMVADGQKVNKNALRQMLEQTQQ